MRPDVTKAQIIAAVGAGVPVFTGLLAAFGVFTPTPAEQHALTEATKWAVGFAALLVLGDAHLRGKRNEADAAKAIAASNGNSHSDPGAAFKFPPVPHTVVAGEALKEGDTVAIARDGKAEHLGARVVYDEPEPDLRDADEVDLADPDLDDPDADPAAGISRSVLAEHYDTAAEPGDVAERDARIGASA